MNLSKVSKPMSDNTRRIIAEKYILQMRRVAAQSEKGA